MSKLECPTELTFRPFFMEVFMENDYLITEKEGKLLMKFSIPCILSLLISALYNIVDQIFIGNSSVGAIGNTATTIIFPLTVIALAFALMLGDGGAAYMSLCMGKGDGKKINKLVGSLITVSILISAIFLLIGFPFLDNIASFFGAKTEESLKYAHEYGFIILIGIPFYIIMNMLNSIIRADGSPKVAMISMVIGAIINIILDACFILGLDLGLTGAALATIIGQIVSFIISVIYLFRAKNFKLEITSFKPDLKLLLEGIKMGASSFFTQISIVIITVVSMNMLAKYGASSKYGINDPQAIIGVVMKLFTIVVNISVGISAGAQPIIGYNYGAGKNKRVKKLFFIIIGLNIILGLIATILFETIPGPILSIFGTNSLNPELYKEFGIMTMRIYLLLINFTIIQKSVSIFLQAMGSPIEAAILSLARDVVGMVIFTVVLPMFWGIEGILWSAPFTDVIGIILAIIFSIKMLKKLNN